jgi:hypothetical protein
MTETTFRSIAQHRPQAIVFLTLLLLVTMTLVACRGMLGSVLPATIISASDRPRRPMLRQLSARNNCAAPSSDYPALSRHAQVAETTAAYRPAVGASCQGSASIAEPGMRHKTRQAELGSLAPFTLISSI